MFVNGFLFNHRLYLRLNNLKKYLLMYDLIKITQNSAGQEVVSARELHQILGLDKTQISRWLNSKIVKNNFLIKNEDYVRLDIVVEGQKTLDFAITLNTAKRLSMMTRTEKGEEVRRYFIECEKIAKDMLEINPPKRLPQNYSEALRELADKNDAIVLLEERNKTLEPRSRYFEQIVLTNGLISMEQTAKLLNIKDMGRNNLFKALREANVIQKNNTSPLQYYIDKGYFELKEEIVVIKNIRKVIVTTLVTQKGLAFLFKFFGLTEKNLSK